MIVYTGGTFDLFHYGHVRLLARCARLAGPGGAVVVGLNTDEFIEQYKGRRPTIGYAGRAEVVEACQYVSLVIPNVGGADSKPAILAAKPDILVVGSDWQDRDYHAQLGTTPEWFAERNIRLIYVAYTDGVSTSKITRLLAPRRPPPR